MFDTLPYLLAALLAVKTLHLLLTWRKPAELLQYVWFIPRQNRDIQIPQSTDLRLMYGTTTTAVSSCHGVCLEKVMLPYTQGMPELLCGSCHWTTASWPPRHDALLHDVL